MTDVRQGMHSEDVWVRAERHRVELERCTARYLEVRDDLAVTHDGKLVAIQDGAVRAISADVDRLYEFLDRERPYLIAPIKKKEPMDKIAVEPIPMRLPCEGCGELHIDEGEFATKPHHTHACQFCGLVWRPAVVPTVGVRYLFKNTTDDYITTRPRVFLRRNQDPEAGLDYETCAICGKHIRHHYGAVEGQPKYRCDPAF